MSKNMIKRMNTKTASTLASPPTGAGTNKKLQTPSQENQHPAPLEQTRSPESPEFRKSNCFSAALQHPITRHTHAVSPACSTRRRCPYLDAPVTRLAISFLRRLFWCRTNLSFHRRRSRLLHFTNTTAENLPKMRTNKTMLCRAYTCTRFAIRYTQR